MGKKRLRTTGLDGQPQSTPKTIFFITRASQGWKILTTLQAAI